MADAPETTGGGEQYLSENAQSNSRPTLKRHVA